MTGNESIAKSNPYLYFNATDRTLATSSNNGLSSDVAHGLWFNDSAGNWSNLVRSYWTSGGAVQLQLSARNRKTDGNFVENHLYVGVKKDGTRYYSVSDASKFRSDLGINSATNLTTGTIPNARIGTTTVSVTKTSLVTSGNIYGYRSGNTVVINVFASFGAVAAWADNVKIATLGVSCKFQEGILYVQDKGRCCPCYFDGGTGLYIRNKNGVAFSSGDWYFGQVVSFIA